MISKHLHSLLLILAAAVFMAAAFAASDASIDLAKQGTKGGPFTIHHGGREEMNYYDLGAVVSFAFGSSCLVAAFMLYRKRN
jgi:hypothetical protein